MTKNAAGWSLFALFTGLVLAFCHCQKRPATPPFSDEKRQLAALVAAADALGADRVRAKDSLLRLAEPLVEQIGRSFESYRFHRHHALDLFEKDPAAACLFTQKNAADWAAPDDSLSAFYQNLNGWVLSESGDCRAAISALELAASLFEKHGPRARLNGTYNNLGRAYGWLGDHEKAILNYESALRINVARGDSLEASKNCYNAAKAWLNLGFSAKAAEKNRAAQAFGIVEAGALELQAAEIALAEGRPDAALRLARSLRAARPEAFGTQNELAFARILLAAGHPAEAAPLFEKWRAKRRTQNAPANWEDEKAAVLHGESLLKTQKPDAALAAFQAAIGASVRGFFDEKDLRALPPVDSVTAQVWPMEAFRAKAEALEALFEKSKNPADLAAALDSWAMAAELFEKVLAAFAEDGSRVVLGEQSFHAFFERPTAAALRLFEISKDKKWSEMAFRFAAWPKAAALRAALAEKKRLLEAGLSTDSIRRFYDLRLAAAALEATARSSSATAAEQADFFDRKRAFDRFQTALRLPKAAPEAAAFDLKKLQAALPDSFLLVEFLVGEHELFVFSTTKNDFAVERKLLPPDFENLVETFCRSAGDWQQALVSEAAAERDYLRTAPALFDFLLKKSLDVQPEARRVCIVPDGPLARLPFAALLMAPHAGSWRDADLPVLIKKKAVSYRFSSFLTEKTSTAAGGFMGFGSEYRDPFTLADLQKNGSSEPHLLALRGGPGALDRADDEVDSLARLLGGEKWLNERATKANFLKNAARSSILHLSLHTVQGSPRDPTSLSILFSKANGEDPNRLTSNELYALDLRASLTVVSACESGAGSVARGEGAMSLGRAMALAGCEATAVNLWKADDAASQKVMIAFYGGLKKGLPKDVALQQAMTEYLETTVSDRALPAFWANFLLVGSVEPLDFAAPQSGLSAFWAAIATMALLFFLRKFLFRMKHF